MNYSIDQGISKSKRDLRRKITVLREGREEKVPIRKIYLIEKTRRGCIAHITYTGKYSGISEGVFIRMNLDEIAASYPEMLRAHSSFLVNPYYILTICDETITLKNGQKHFASRSLKRELTEAFNRWFFRRAGLKGADA